MKIGILTFHREVNDGSVLQCYCLYRLLSELLPDAQIEVIDYRPRYLRRKRRVACLTRRPPFVLFEWQKVVKKRQQASFTQRNLRLSETLDVNDALESAKQAIDAQRYDAIVVGSDTVWDTRPGGGAPQAPNIYFLPGLDSVQKVAFAASMDKGGPGFVGPETWRRLMGYVADFDLISVRDGATRNWLEEAGVATERIHDMPDPTLLHDFSQIVVSPQAFVADHPNLAAVAVFDTRLRIEATRQLLDLGYEVMNLLCAPVKGQLSLPRDWSFGERVGLHAHFRVMITDRFHGSIFALKQEPSTPVLLVEPDHYYAEPNSKGRDLFERLGLGRMVFRYCRDQAISPTLIQDALKRHGELGVDVEQKMATLRSAAKPLLDELRTLLANP